MQTGPKTQHTDNPKVRILRAAEFYRVSCNCSLALAVQHNSCVGTSCIVSFRLWRWRSSVPYVLVARFSIALSNKQFAWHSDFVRLAAWVGHWRATGGSLPWLHGMARLANDNLAVIKINILLPWSSGLRTGHNTAGRICQLCHMATVSCCSESISN